VQSFGYLDDWLREREEEMNSTKQHAMSGYDLIAEMLEEEGAKGTKFSAVYCQSLLETAETYAQQAQALPLVEEKLLEARMMIGEMIEHFRMPHLNKEARNALIERAERVLNNDTNNPGATSGSQTTE
jgi:hypothetical protein